MTERYGVDSAARANVGLTNSSLKLYDHIKQNMGTPTFWGRYLTTQSGTSFGLTNENNGIFTSTGEASYLHEKGCSVLLIDNRETGKRSSATDGESHAKKAILAAQALGVPYGTTIFLDIEYGVTTKAAYMNAYRQTLENGRLCSCPYYMLGIYTSSGWVSHINSAFSCANRPMYIAEYRGDTSTFPSWDESPNISSGNEVIWQHKGGTPGEYPVKTTEGLAGVDLNVVPNSSIIFDYMW